MLWGHMFFKRATYFENGVKGFDDGATNFVIRVIDEMDYVFTC